MLLIPSAILQDKGLALLVRPAILLHFSLFTQIQRRRSQINIAILNQSTHPAEEESQNQRGDMATVHIGIGHDDYLVITNLFQVQRLRVVLCTHRYTHGTEDILDFLAFENLVVHGLLHIQNLTTQWEDSLIITVASLLCRTAGRVSLDEEKLALRRVFRRTIGQFARKSATRKRRFALH